MIGSFCTLARGRAVALLVVACAWRLLPVGASGSPDGEPSPGSASHKSQYTLFHPTPDALLREMTTDRPDRTESPFTVDAGHFQVEMDVLTYTRDRDQAGGVQTEGLSAAVMNLKAGLLNHLDLQVFLQPYTSLRTTDLQSGVQERWAGFGDTTVRLKWNLWGNDGGKTAFALMPFATFPTADQNLGAGAVEGGLILPFGMDLPFGFSLGAMSEWDFRRNASDDGGHAEIIHTVTLGHDLVGKLAGYVEFFALVNTEADAPWLGTVDVGFTYSLNSNLQLDAGVNIGVTESADDLNPFLGLSFRF